MPLSRDTSSEVNAGSLREQCVRGCQWVCVCATYAQVPMCEHAYVSASPWWGQNGSQWAGISRTGPCGWRERGGEGWWLLADGVQQGRGSLLMKSHLRPPFTLNMGHCSCPDLGFDPQRCLTPTNTPELPPTTTIWRGCMHMYTYMHAHTPTDTLCMYTMTQYRHMRSQVWCWIVQVAVQHHAAFHSKLLNYAIW